MSKEFSPEAHRLWLAEQPKKMIVVKIIIKSDLGNILIAKPTYKKTWQLPGGGIDSGESPEDAAIREVREELDFKLEKQALKITGTIHKQSDDILFLIYEYTNLIDEGTAFILPSDEIETYDFVQPSALSERLPSYYADFLKHYNT